MVVLVTWKNEEDPIKMKALEWSQHYRSILRCSSAANSIIGDEILTDFKLIQAFLVVHLICKNEYELL